MGNSLKVLHVALQKGNYDLAAHALVYGLVKASITGRGKLASPAIISEPCEVGPASNKVTSPSHDNHVFHKLTDATSLRLLAASSPVIPAKAEIHISVNPSRLGNGNKNREER